MIRNKNVLITGASSGIGEALAVYYAQNGAANLFICGRNVWPKCARHANGMGQRFLPKCWT